MIWVLYLCGIGVILCVYMLVRNNWVYGICIEMTESIYIYNMKLIKNGIYDKNNLSYDSKPTYKFMLYYKFYNWNKSYFKAFLDEKMIKGEMK